MTSIDGNRDGVSDRYEIDIVETRQDARASGAVGRGHIAWHEWRTQGYTKNAKGKSDHIKPPHSPTPVPVLTVSGAAGAKAISLQPTPPILAP